MFFVAPRAGVAGNSLRCGMVPLYVPPHQMDNNIMDTMTETDIERLMAMIDQSDGCWFWNGPRDDNYNPVFEIDGVAHSPRDILCYDKYGITTINPCKAMENCLNPIHSILGKTREARSGLKGSEVVEILASNESVYSIAKTYKVCKVTIYNIINNVTWQHIKRNPRIKRKRKRKGEVKKVKAPQKLINTDFTGIKFDPDTGQYIASYYRKHIGESDSLEGAIAIRREHTERIS